MWMCCSRTDNSKVNRLHERCLRIIYQEEQSLFEGLLEKDNFLSIRHTKSLALAIEIYKVRNKFSSILIQELFMQYNKHGYNLRNLDQFKTISVHATYDDTESFSFLEPKILKPVNLSS